MKHSLTGRERVPSGKCLRGTRLKVVFGSQGLGNYPQLPALARSRALVGCFSGVMHKVLGYNKLDYYVCNSLESPLRVHVRRVDLV